MSNKGRPARAFSKEQIQQAIENSRSFIEAARYLNCTYNTFKKYALLYELWIEGGKNPSAKGIPKIRTTSKRQDHLEKILGGKWNGKAMNLTKFRERLIREVKLAERCDLCGFEEKRVTDLKVPLVLCFKDGDRRNYKLENLQLKCWNCSFLTEGNVVGRKKDYFSDSVTGDVWKQLDV